MPKIRLRIDSDIQFCVSATIEAFGFEAAVAIRRKRVAGGPPQLTKGHLIDEVAEASSMPRIEPPEPSD